MDEAAKRRASFARADRIKRETAQAAEQEQARQRGPAEASALEEKRRAATIKAAATRVEQFRKLAQERRDRLRKEQTQKEFNRKAENTAGTAKVEAQRKDAARIEAQKQDASRRAAADVAERHKRQLADQQAEHRRQTGEVRSRHQAETRSLRANDDTAINRHWHAVRNIDQAEQRELSSFDTQRRSLTGRIAETVRGSSQYDRKREEVQQRFEGERMTKHRDLEALKERQSQVAQDTRLKQAHERKASIDAHRADRTQLQQAQAAERPRQIEQREQAITRAQAAPEHTMQQSRSYGPRR